MQRSSSLFNRPDTLFGVCEGIGQEFSFNANYLRIVFAVSLLWNPAVVIGAYVVLGAAVALSRWLFPVRASGTSEPIDGQFGKTVAGENDQIAAAIAA